MKRLQESVKKGAAGNVKILTNTSSTNTNTSTTAMMNQLNEKVCFINYQTVVILRFVCHHGFGSVLCVHAH